MKGKMLPLASEKVLHLLTDLCRCPLFALPQFDAGFLLLTSCMPSTALPASLVVTARW